MSAEKAPQLLDKILFDFEQNNPHAVVILESGKIIVEKPWGIQDARLEGQDDDKDFINALNNLILNPKFDAIFHIEEQLIEFIYQYVDTDDDDENVYGRSFEVFFQGNKFECSFTDPTFDFNTITKHFVRLPYDPSRTSVHQLDMFSDAQRLDNLPSFIVEYFENRTACNFIIKSEKQLVDLDHVKLSRHINFLLKYYDRNSPVITIHRDIDQKDEEVEPLRYIENSFPKKLHISEMDDIVLKLIEVANKSTPRFSFLYFYQVIEYAAHHFIDNECKNEIRNILKDPAVIACEEEVFSKLMEIIVGMNKDDSTKMKDVMVNYCDPDIIWKEVEKNRSFFESKCVFDGGVEIDAFIHSDISEKSWKSIWMPKIYYQLTKIRNTIVHAKEKRETNSILPTVKNNQLLEYYCPIIQRIAEQIAIKGCK